MKHIYIPEGVVDDVGATALMLGTEVDGGVTVDDEEGVAN